MPASCRLPQMNPFNHYSLGPVGEWLGFLVCEAGAGCYSFVSHLNDGDGSDE